MAQRKFPDWATLDIADIGNGDPNKADPGATKQQEGWKVEKPFLQDMNWIQNLFGHFSRANNEYKNTVATSTEAEAGEIHVIDNTTASKDFLLPGAPFTGQWVRVAKLAAFSTNPVTIQGNGNNIGQAGVSVLNLDIDFAEFAFYFDGVLWKVLKTAATQTATSATGGVSGYFPSDVPVGATMDWPGSLGSIPVGYLPEDGGIYNVADYPVLAVILGSTYGGDGVITFGVRDMRGRVSGGMDNMGTVQGGAGRVTNPAGATLGGTLGAENHVLSETEMPAHTHGPGTYGYAVESTDLQAGASATLVSGITPNTSVGGVSGSTGGGAAHNNMQPTLFSHKIIKAQ